MTQPDLDELATRWERARAAAGTSERLLFEHSLTLGKGFARFHHGPVKPQQLPGVLAALGVPCLTGTWSEDPVEPAYWLERPPCSAATAAGCDGWREAISGLVLGVTGGVCHSRHRSGGHGDRRCVDVVHTEALSPLRFGAIPPELSPGLDSVRRLIARFRGGAEVRFLGVCEGALLYRIIARQPGPHPLGQIVARCLLKRFPSLQLRELADLPVLDAGDMETR